MFYELLYPLKEHLPWLNIFRYITFRAAMAAFTALVLAMVVYPKFIAFLKRKGAGEAAKEDAPENHMLKAGTPTMGGIVILITIILPVLLWAKLSNIYVIVALSFLTLFGMIGFFDDLIKLRFKNKRDKFLAEQEENWLKTHEESQDSIILSSENNRFKMDRFINLICSFLALDEQERSSLEWKPSQDETSILSDQLKDDYYQFRFKKNCETTLAQLREIWQEKGKSYESWDKFFLNQEIYKEELQEFQKKMIDYLDMKFHFKVQETRRGDKLVDSWYRWVSLPYALQELQRQKRKWALSFWRGEKKKRTFMKDADGLRGSFRLILEFVISGGLLFTLFVLTQYSTNLQIPFLKSVHFDLGSWYIFFGMLVIVSFANAVNLTDGLDGLAIGPIMIAMVTLGVFTYLAGNVKMASYLHITYIEDIGELTIFAIAVFAAGMGFLWFNTYPAQIFMGDVGSLGLGAAFGSLLVMSKVELLGLVLGGLFVLEAVSVVIQVSVYKTRKVRVFRMAPIHHHFEKMGIHESKIIVRFWLVAILLAIISLATLKIR